jgi:hypothetical protein
MWQEEVQLDNDMHAATTHRHHLLTFQTTQDSGLH